MGLSSSFKESGLEIYISSDTSGSMTEVVQQQSGLLLPDVKSGDVVLQANGKVGGACSGKDGGGQGQDRSQDDVLEFHFVQGNDCKKWVLMSLLRRPIWRRWQRGLEDMQQWSAVRFFLLPSIPS